MENRVPGIRENYHQAPRIKEIGSLQVHTGYLTFSSKKTVFSETAFDPSIAAKVICDNK